MKAQHERRKKRQVQLSVILPAKVGLLHLFSAHQQGEETMETWPDFFQRETGWDADGPAAFS